MTQTFDLDAAIAQAIEAEQQAKQAAENTKKQLEAEEELQQRTYLQELLNKDLANELQQQLGLEIKKLTFGYVGAFQLTDERDDLVEGCISAEKWAGRPEGWNIRLPDLNRFPAQRTFHSDGSGGTQLFCERQELQQKLLYTLGLWRNRVAELKAQAQKQAEQNRQLQEQREREAAEREQQQREQAALQQRLEELHKQIEPQVTLLVEQCRWKWPEDKVLTIYQWDWCKGFAGEFDSGGEYDRAYSLEDSLNENGYFATVTGECIKLIPAVHKPVVRQLKWEKLEDLSAELLKTHHFHIEGVQWRNGLMRYAEDGSIPHAQKIPVEWVQALLDTEVTKAAVIYPPPGFDPTQFADDPNYDSIPF
jgi:hypothetical protein